MVYKAKYAQLTYRVGDTRTKRTFAWLPVRIKDDMIWLETFETLQYYTLKQYPVIGSQPEQAYNVYEWIDIASKRIPKIVIEQI